MTHQPTKPDYHDPTGTLEQRITDIGRELKDSITALLKREFPSPCAPRHLTNRLGVNKHFASKLLIALGKESPLAVTHYIPGHEGLRTFIDKCDKRGVDASIVKRVRKAVDLYEALVEDDLGGKAALESVVSGRVDEIRRHNELRGRQLAFRGLCSVHGSMMDTLMSNVLVFPSERDRDMHDSVQIVSWVKFRRLRLGIDIIHFESDKCKLHTLNNTPLNLSPQDCILSEYSSKPPPEVRIVSTDQFTEFRVVSEHIGVDNAATLSFATRRFSSIFASHTRPERHLGMSVWPLSPARRLVLDIHLHKDVWADRVPKLMLRDSAHRDFRHIDDCLPFPNDVFATTDTITCTPAGQSVQRIDGIPWYTDMLLYAMRKTTFNPADFRGYRYVCLFPLHAMNHHIYFCPPKHASPSAQ